MKFKTTPLFGGAIVVDLPEGFQDVRLVRVSFSLSSPYIYMFVTILAAAVFLTRNGEDV